jgi:hypothetical protein
MTDIFFEYKDALHKAFSMEATEREEEKRIRRGKPAYTEEEYNERLNHFLTKIPQRLGWVKESGRTEPSTIQESYPQAPSRVYYRITVKGRKASAKEIADPIQTLYHYSRKQRSAKRYSYYMA